MKRSNGSLGPARKSTGPKRREQLLAEFDSSGLSAAAFARRHGVHYTTFCGWRQRRAKASPKFVQVELEAAAAPVPLVIELGARARMRITSAEQLPLAAGLLLALNPPSSC